MERLLRRSLSTTLQRIFEIRKDLLVHSVTLSIKGKSRFAPLYLTFVQLEFESNQKSRRSISSHLISHLSSLVITDTTEEPLESFANTDTTEANLCATVERLLKLWSILQLLLLLKRTLVFPTPPVTITLQSIQIKLR